MALIQTEFIIEDSSTIPGWAARVWLCKPQACSKAVNLTHLHFTYRFYLHFDIKSFSSPPIDPSTMSGVEAAIGAASFGVGLLSLVIQLGESIYKLKGFKQRVRGSSARLDSLLFDLEIAIQSLDQLDRYGSQHNMEAALLSLCVKRWGALITDIERATNKMQNVCARFPRLGKLHIGLNEPEIEKLLRDLDQARGSLCFSLVVFQSEQQSKRDDEQREVLNYQSRQLDHIWRAIQTQGTELARLSSYSSGRLVAADTEPAESSQLSSEKEVTNYAVAGWRENEQYSNREDQQVAMEWRIQFPQWMCTRIWRISATHAKTGWKVSLKTYIFRPASSEVFYRCQMGDMKGMQKLMSEGQASPRDIPDSLIRVQRGYFAYRGINLLQVRTC